MLTTCNTLQLHLWMIFNYLFVCIYCKGYIYYLFLVNVIVKSLLHLPVLLIEYFISIYSTILSVCIFYQRIHGRKTVVVKTMSIISSPSVKKKPNSFTDAPKKFTSWNLMTK